MADNTQLNVGSSGDLIQSDVITTLNGVADVSGAKAQRVKVGWGVDGTFNDVNAANPLPIIDNDTTASGTITAAAQTVAIVLNGDSGAAIQITGTWVGTLQFEGTLDGTNWVAINAVAASTSLPQVTNTVNGLFRLTPCGLAQMRINATAWTSGTATISIRASAATGGTFINQVAAVSLNELEIGLPIGMTSLRDLTVAQRYTTWGDSIADGISIDWIQSLTNGGTLASTGGEGLLQTSANALGTAQIVGPIVNYYPGQVDWINSAVRLGDTGSTGNTRRWGRFTISAGVPQDGFAFELVDTVFYATTFKGGVATRVASTSWTKVAIAPYILDLNYLGGEIRFTSNACQFYVNNILRHTASGGALPITNTLNLPISAQNINTSGATNRVLGIRNIGQGRFGSPIAPTQLVTYSAVSSSVVPAALATDLVTIYGSATKTINILNIWVTGIQATAGQAQFLLIKRSTANTLGTSTSSAKIQYDSNDVAATATVLAYTANPTLGTAIGNIRGDRIFLPGAASASDAQGLVWSFIDSKQLILRGVTQGLCINLNGATITGGSINVTIEWTEI